MNESSIRIERRAVEPFLKNGYVVVCPETREAAYIDPGDEAVLLVDFIDRQRVRLVAVLNTHAHMDHICGIGQVRERWDAPIYLHPDDLPLYDSLEVQGQWFGMSYPPAPRVDRELLPGQELWVGRIPVKVHHTPGHSPGGVCLEMGEHVFCGDLIFAGSIGRTDLPGGSYETLMTSIREVLLPLGDEKILHPGHGPETTIARERATNPFLTGSPHLGALE